MQWEFRKTIESFEGYKRTITFKNDIENGDQNTLDTVIREIEMILGDKNQKIVTKVLALRFIRDLMVLGQEDIVKRVEKLIPQLTKICSHELENTDPDRGQTFFHDHPAYIKARSEEEKKEIDTYGSTYLILALESIFHWANWIPIDSNGQESIYSKAYQTLVDRKVTFPTSFHYYKQSDTEKFKNTYKMEFFTDSYESAYSETSSLQQSQLSEPEEKQSRSGWEKKSRGKESKPFQTSIVGSQQYTGQAHNLRSVNQIMKYLNELRVSKTRKMGSLRQIHKNIQDMYEMKGGIGKLPKDEKKWLENYIINFSLLNSNLIDYNQFLQRSLSEEIVIEEGIQEEDITINKDYRASPMKPQLTPTKSIKEMSKVNKTQLDREGSQIMRKQEYEYKTKLNTLAVELQEKDNEIAIIRSNYEKEKQKLIEDYQCRIGIIKTEVRKGQQDKGNFERELEKDNQRLRAKVAALEGELANSNYNTDRQRDLESQRNHLLTRVKRLEIENEKLQQIKSVNRNYDKDISNLEAIVKEKQAAMEALKAELKKAEKINSNCQDEATLYKTELINERAKHEQKISTVAKTKEALENQNKSLKEKTLEYRKTLDVKEIELINLKQELRRYQSKVKDLNDKKSMVGMDNQKSEQWAKSRTAMQYQSPTRLQVTTSPEKQVYEPQMFASNKQLRFTNYEDLYQELRPNNKELFIRLCRCGLKRKDILLKENELEIGIITDVLSENKLKFLLHFTNTSQKQVENLKIEYNLINSYPTTLDYSIDNKYIFCIQPQEQEKVSVTVTNKQAPFIKERAILEISFEKNGILYESNIFLPFFIPKFCDFYKPKGIKLQDRTKYPKEVSQFRYNKKMLPKPTSLKGFFDGIEEIIPNKYELEALHRDTDLIIKLGFVLTPDSEGMQLQAQVMREKINEKQKFVFEELFSFLEVAFRR